MVKNLFCFLILIGSSIISPVILNAQVSGTPPEGFTYQAEARDRDGNAIANTKLSAQIILFQDEINGKIVYREIHKVTTDDFGMFTLVIGNGTSKNNFANIKWGLHSHFINVKIKRLEDQRAINMGTTQLLSVPYALHAKTADKVGSIKGDPIINEILESILNTVGDKPSGIFFDERDNKKYKWVKIGSQIWMAENLRYNAEGSWVYNNDPVNLSFYGRLYDWETTMNGDHSSPGNPIGVQGICPKGWHIPSDTEWSRLTNYISSDGHSGEEGLALMSEFLWSRNDIPDSYGFKGLPGGLRKKIGDSFGFSDIQKQGIWWSSTEESSFFAYYRSLVEFSKEVFRDRGWKEEGYSVRCIKDL